MGGAMTSGTNTWQRISAAAIAAAMLLTGCWGGDDDDSDAPPDATSPSTTIDDEPIVSIEGVAATDEAAVARLGLRLSEGTPARPLGDNIDLVEGAALTADEIAAILDRLPTWVIPDADQQEFNRPADTLLPPLVGDTVDTPFPPPTGGDGPAAPDAGPLEVLRFQPEGPVDIAPFLSVTFNQPMVPLATLDQLDAADVPVEITPAIEGRWRWIGTRTLRFELVPGELDRLPAATSYDVLIPQGTRSANGATLRQAVSWSFTTPTPTVTGFVGESESLPLAPVFVAVFDQRVDPTAVLAVTSLTADGTQQPLRLATPAEIDADEAARRSVDNALDARAVAFRPVQELAADAALEVTIGPGTPSAEGPLTSSVADTYRARTFGRLKITDTSCDWGDGCAPGVPFTIRFSNALDPDTFSAEQVSVSPAIPGLRINVYGDVIELSGATAGRTTLRGAPGRRSAGRVRADARGGPDRRVRCRLRST